MTDTTGRTRQPKGSPNGGEFVAEVGAEASAALAGPQHSPTIPVVLCSDCHVECANEHPDPKFTDNSTCAACFDDGVDCDHEGYSTDEFSDNACAKCGTTMAGHRHHYAYWPHEHEVARSAAFEAQLANQRAEMREWEINEACRVTYLLVDRMHRNEMTENRAATLRSVLMGQTQSVLTGEAEPDPHDIGAALAAINSDVPTTQAVVANWNGASHGGSTSLVRGDFGTIREVLVTPETGVPEMRHAKHTQAKITPETAARVRSRIAILEEVAGDTHLAAGPRYLRAALAHIEGASPSEVADLAEQALKANNRHILSTLLQMASSRVAFEGAQA